MDVEREDDQESQPPWNYKAETSFNDIRDQCQEECKSSPDGEKIVSCIKTGNYYQDDECLKYKCDYLSDPDLILSS